MVSNWQFNHQICQKWNPWSLNYFSPHIFITNYGFRVISIEIGHLGWIQGSRICTGCNLDDDLRPQTSKYLDRAFLIKNCIFYQPIIIENYSLNKYLWSKYLWFLFDADYKTGKVSFLIENRVFYAEIWWKSMKIAWNCQPTGILTDLELIILTRCRIRRGCLAHYTVDKYILHVFDRKFRENL